MLTFFFATLTIPFAMLVIEKMLIDTANLEVCGSLAR
jgi:hypothetical protein